MTRLSFLSLLLSVCLLPACASDPVVKSLDTVEPAAANGDPSDDQLRVAVTESLERRMAPANSVYDYERVDLNGDGLRDALVI